VAREPGGALGGCLGGLIPALSAAMTIQQRRALRCCASIADGWCGCRYEKDQGDERSTTDCQAQLRCRGAGALPRLVAAHWPWVEVLPDNRTACGPPGRHCSGRRSLLGRCPDGWSWRGAAPRGAWPCRRRGRGVEPSHVAKSPPHSAALRDSLRSVDGARSEGVGVAAGHGG
jgi:hypothetical protein